MSSECYDWKFHCVNNLVIKQVSQEERSHTTQSRRKNPKKTEEINPPCMDSIRGGPKSTQQKIYRKQGQRTFGRKYSYFASLCQQRDPAPGAKVYISGRRTCVDDAHKLDHVHRATALRGAAVAAATAAVDHVIPTSHGNNKSSSTACFVTTGYLPPYSAETGRQNGLSLCMGVFT